MGDLPLDWTLSEVPGMQVEVVSPVTRQPVTVIPEGIAAQSSGSVSSVSQANPEAVLWDQPIGTTGYGGVSSYNNSGIFGAFSADDFVNASPWAIDTIFIDGLDQAANLLRATSLTWYIYPDAAGVPAGYPGDGMGSEIWSLTLAPTDPAVTIGLRSPGCHR